MGNANQMNDVIKLREDPDMVVADPHKYMMQRIKEYVDDKKIADEISVWNPVTVWYMAGVLKCTISDPKILLDIQSDNTVLDKYSPFYALISDTRMMDNLMQIPKGPEQVKRRRTLTTGVSNP